MKTFLEHAKVLTLLLLISAVFASEAFCEVEFKVKLSPQEVEAFQECELEAVFFIPKDLHVYSSESQKSGIPTKITLLLPEGFSLVSETWPTPKNFEYFGETSKGYDGNFSVIFKLRSPKKIAENSEREILARAEWLACGQLCTPGSSETPVKVKLIASSSPNKGASNILTFILGAFLGGMILNLMPCVFPVIGLKIMSFSESAKSGKKRDSLLHALMYTLGIILSFALLGGIIIAARNAGENLGWGFQLQNPFFVALMAILFFAMALSFAGVFEIGTFAASFGVKNFSLKNKTDGGNFYSKILKSFGSGIFATLVASPCTAPFMGAAVGAALTLDTALAFVIFVSMGLGMAFPYLLLSAFPSLAKILPRPGMWMDFLKQILSIPLFASAVWLCAVFAMQTPPLSVIWLLCAFLILAIGLRIFSIFNAPIYGKAARIFAVFCAIASLSIALWIAKIASNSEGENLQNLETNSLMWSPERVENLRKEGKMVYVDFTAAWCLTCQFNKRVFNDPKIQSAFKENDIAFLVGDWTNKNAAIAAELNKFGRAGVPLNLIYSPEKNAAPEILPAILTVEAVLEAIDKIKK